MLKNSEIVKKIITIGLIAFFSLPFWSCEQKYKSPIPDVPVEVNLHIPSFNPTFGSALNDTLLFTYPRRYPPFAIGYGGMLVVVGYDEKLAHRYHAYDLCCPYEADRNVRVYPDDAGTAVCRKCGSTFYTTDGWGRVSKGPSKFPLKRYRTDYVNHYLVIRNY